VAQRRLLLELSELAVLLQLLHDVQAADELAVCGNVGQLEYFLSPWRTLSSLRMSK